MNRFKLYPGGEGTVLCDCKTVLLLEIKGPRIQYNNHSVTCYHKEAEMPWAEGIPSQH